MSIPTTLCPHCQESVPQASLNGAGLASCPRCGRLLFAPPPSSSQGNARRSSGWSILIGVGALAVLAVAALVIARSIRDEIREKARGPQLASAPAPAQAAPPLAVSQGEPGSVRSLLSVVRVGKGKEERPVVMLGRPTSPGDYENGIKGTLQGILLREVIRQAVLIAARDELGLATRDEVLGDPITAAPKGQEVEICSVFREAGKSRATIRRVSAAGGNDKDKAKSAILLDQPLALAAMPKVVEAVEALSRVELPKVLNTLGLSGKPNAKRAEAALPEGVEERMRHMTETDLFVAVRALHAAIQADGESPARLAALARCYAMLGVLTEYQWSPAHKVFKARALLYSQRLVAPDVDNPFALWNRAFVRALVGMHAGANVDLKWAAAQARKHAGPKPVPPDWVPLIEAYLLFDTKTMQAEHEADEGLAGLLRLLANEFPKTRSQTVKTTREILVRDPDCFRAIDAMCQVGGISDLHAATMLGLAVLDQVVPKKLQALKAIPPRVNETIDRQRGEPAMIEALRKSGAPADDQGEPSWAALGQMVAEIRFVQVWHRLSFMRNKWSVPVDEFWAESHLSVAGHRYRPYLESLTLPPQESVAVLMKFVETLDLNDLEVKEFPVKTAIHRLPVPRAMRIGVAMQVHHDMLAHDLAELCYLSGNSLEIARRVLRLTGHSPFARAVLIEKDWDSAKGKLAQWEKDPATAESPTLLAAIANHYIKAKQPDDARKALESYIKLAPEYWAYVALADNYKASGDRTRYLETLEDFLKHGENGGLDYATVQTKIAYDLMNHYQAERAKPYAEAAAATWAGWAMECAGQCHEALGNHERAEYWFRNEAERYPRSFMQWFQFCKRTLHGDLAAATDLAVAYVKNSPQLSENEKCLAVILFDLSDDPKQGMDFLQAQLNGPPIPANVPGGRFAPWIERMYLARFADPLNQTKLRDDCWAQVSKGDPPAAAKVVALFQQTLAAKKARPFDRKSFDALMESTDGYTRGFLLYFMGRFLQQHGTIEDAAYYLERSGWPIPDGNTFVAMSGSSALRALLGGKIPDDSHLHWIRAWYHRAEDRTDLALKDLNEALRLDPKNTEAINLRGIVKRNADDLEGALADFSTMIELAPTDSQGLVGRGVTYVLLGQDAKASADIEKAIELSPKAGPAYVAKGLLALAQGKEAEANTLFDKALDIDRGFSKVIEKLEKTVKQKRTPKAT